MPTMSQQQQPNGAVAGGGGSLSFPLRLLRGIGGGGGGGGNQHHHERNGGGQMTAMKKGGKTFRQPAVAKRNETAKERLETIEQRSELLKESIDKSFQAALNAGEDDEMLLSGYRRSAARTACTWIGFILTAGILRLVMHWWKHWLLLATHAPCSLDVAEQLLITERYQGKHSVHYVKKVVTLNGATLAAMREHPERWGDMVPLGEPPVGGGSGGGGDANNMSDDSMNVDRERDDGGDIRMSIHFQGGHFKTVDSIRMFKCKQLRYVWDEQSGRFAKLVGLDTDVPSVMLHQQQGLTSAEQYARRLVYGPNTIYIPLKSVMTLLFLEALNPFYVFQVFSVVLWFSYNYYYYAVVIILMTGFGISMSILQTRKNQLALYRTVTCTDSAILVNADGTTQIVETKFLVPGDILEIPSSGCTMNCDAVLLSGNCILDESMLTGESVPVTKTPMPCKRDIIFDQREHARHVLFCGTKVIQTRYIGTERVLAIVINTGNITAKGGLVRSILYPPPVDYKFEQDSFKFISLLAGVAALGFFYTLYSKIMRGISAGKIAIEALDLITIAVPPALPAAMSVGRFYAQKRLETNNIYCISPRSINVSGSIDCVCFDKTGTLTEDGLDMWGVIPVSSTGSGFQIPLRDVQRLPYEHFLFGMVTCHSITIMGGELKGDPLDLKMFESSGWLLEEANDVADDAKYDLLFPTMVRPPRQSGFMIADTGEDDEDGDLSGSMAGGSGGGGGTFGSHHDLGIVREFSFTSALQRMAVVTRKLLAQNFHVYCKGSPEMIETLCRPGSMPADFHATLEEYAQQGYRIIALAHKPLDKKITYAKVQRIAREKIECDLEFLGLVVLENRLKADTADVVQSLMRAAIRTVMVTGDNMLTALSVARDCGMVPKGQSVITVNARAKADGKPDSWELFYTLTGQANGGGGGEKNFRMVMTAETPTNNGGGGGDYALMTNSNSVASLETVDTFTHNQTSSFAANGDPENGYKKHERHDDDEDDSDDGSVRLAPELPCNNYRFAMTGKTWAILRDEFPELLPQFVTRGTIFARMSPDQKQALVLELQDLGYYVAMCGDGANDCGALKAAHAGISLSEAESSVASPFTSRNPTIACVPTVIREGRAALVTSVGIFKYMAAYSIVQFASVLILYSIDSNLTDIQFLYIDLCIISVFAFFFGKTASWEGPLVRQTPLSSLVSVSPVASLVLHLLVAIAFQAAGWLLLQQQEWFVPFEFNDSTEMLGCWENYAVFTMSCYQYIILAFVFSKGRPYRKSIWTNYGLLASMLVNVTVAVFLTMQPQNNPIASFFELVMPPDVGFRLWVLAFGVANLLISVAVEAFVVDRLLFKKLRYRWHNIEKSRRKYLAVENRLRQDAAWPPLSLYQSSGVAGSVEKELSDLPGLGGPGADGFAEICVESGVETGAPFIDRNNSVLNSFFASQDDDDELVAANLNATMDLGLLEPIDEVDSPKENGASSSETSLRTPPNEVTLNGVAYGGGTTSAPAVATSSPVGKHISQLSIDLETSTIVQLNGNAGDGKSGSS